VLAHRFARERLHALGQVEGTIAKAVQEAIAVRVIRDELGRRIEALLAEPTPPR